MNGAQIEYDEIGNPESDGTWSYAWQHGRELASMSGNGTTWDFEYNADGLRTKRTNNSTTYQYVYNGSTLVQMTVGNNTLYFTSDTVTYNGTTYYYAKNLQGDIVAILNSSGTAVVQYTYDAWGKLLSTTGSMANTLGVHNPLRYRGYVYDTETGLYYLQSRYYNPNLGRFLNADALVSTGQGVLGNNMFAYCGNNPVINYDPYGFWTDGQIHDEVIEEIVKRSGNRYKHKRHDTLIVYEVAWGLKWFGFCDLYDPQTGEVWELKKNTASTSCSTPRALAQLQNYVKNGHLLSDISLQLKVGETYVQGGFFTRTDPSGTQYFISYWDQGGGILRYDYVAIPSEFDVLAAATVGYAFYVSITIQDSGKHNVHNVYYESLAKWKYGIS